MEACEHCEKIVRQLSNVVSRLLSQVTLVQDEAVTLARLGAQLKTQSEAPEPPPETPEADLSAEASAEEETARLSLEFVKWAGLKVVCDYKDRGYDWSQRPHGFNPNKGVGCKNPRPAESLTVDVVLEVLDSPDRGRAVRYWLIYIHRIPLNTRSCRYEVRILSDTEVYETRGPNAKLALLRAWERALDAAGVMDKED